MRICGLLLRRWAICCHVTEADQQFKETILFFCTVLELTDTVGNFLTEVMIPWLMALSQFPINDQRIIISGVTNAITRPPLRPPALDFGWWFWPPMGRSFIFVVVQWLSCKDNFPGEVVGKLLSSPEAKNYQKNLILSTPKFIILGQGNIFSSVCQEFCSGGSTTLHAGIPPRTKGRPPGPDADPPGANTPPPWSRPPPPWEKTPPAQCMLGDTGNKRAVRILMECKLVWEC